MVNLCSVTVRFAACVAVCAAVVAAVYAAVCVAVCVAVCNIPAIYLGDDSVFFSDVSVAKCNVILLVYFVCVVNGGNIPETPRD